MDQPRYTSAKYLRPGDVLCDGRRVLNTCRRRADIHLQVPERYEIVFVWDDCAHDYLGPRPDEELVAPLHRFKVKSFGWEDAQAQAEAPDPRLSFFADGEVRS